MIFEQKINQKLQMGLLKRPSSPISLTLLLIISFSNLFPSSSQPASSSSSSSASSSSSSSSDYTSLVYKGCANQTFSDPNGDFSQTLKSLYDSLISQSSKVKFYKTSSGNGQTSISGVFQCRGDLTNGDCHNCVSQIPQTSSRVCGNAVAARIQLHGCYGLYEISGFPKISGLEMLYKTCSGSVASGAGFEERRDTAFSSMETGLAGANGFYATSYQSVYVLGQCQGDLSSNDCQGCVKTAVQRAQVECGNSISGQVYLYKCYINFAYYPNGISKKSSSGIGQSTGKTVAIVVGGVAAAGFSVICLLFLRSLLKKHDDD